MADDSIDRVGTPEGRTKLKIFEQKLLTRSPKLFDLMQKFRSRKEVEDAEGTSKLGLKARARKRQPTSAEAAGIDQPTVGSGGSSGQF